MLGVMLIATLIAIELQFFSAQLGIVTQKGLSENIVSSTSGPVKTIVVSLVVVGILLGNSSFEVGNIVGTSVGIGNLASQKDSIIVVPCIVLVCCLVLWNGKYAIIERVLGIVVLVMAFCFVVSSVLLKPDFALLFKGLLDLRIFNKDILLAGALLGTTIGSYQLFLHSRSASEKWHSVNDIKTMAIDTGVSIGLGGLISISIISLAATASQKYGIEEMTIVDFSSSLSRPLGKIGKGIFDVGLVAAGLSSAITAPLAAAYTISGLTSEKYHNSRLFFKAVWGIVLLFGGIVALVWKSSPSYIITTVQVINAIILPMIVILLIYCLNQKNNDKRNSIVENLILGIIVCICFAIGLKNIVTLF